MLKILTAETASAYVYRKMNQYGESGVLFTGVERHEPSNGDPALYLVRGTYPYNDGRVRFCWTVWMEDGQLYGEW